MSAKLWLVPSLLLLAGCGYVGDPLPPSLNIPQPVADLRAVQRADRVEVAFTIPALTTDGIGLRLSGVELRAAPSDPGGDLDAWAASADAFEVTADEPGEIRHRVPIGPWIGRQVWIAVRVASHKKRWSPWSNVASLNVIAAVNPPREVKAEAAPEGARLSWSFADTREGRQVRVWKKGPGEPAFTEVAIADGDAWVDAAAQFGLTYEYAVQAVISDAESLRTEPVSVTPVDTFAPAAPGGLTAIAGIASIELAWERSPEADVAGYRIYRGAGDGPLSQLADQMAAPSFSDRETASGAKYRYAVAAVDRDGNVSPQSAPVEIEAP